MRSLLQFLRKIAPFLLFLVLEVVALVLLFSDSNYHGSVRFSSANRFNARMYEVRHRLTAYIGLKQTNEALWVRNGELEKEVAALRQALDGTLPEGAAQLSDEYEYVYANVLKNSIQRNKNHLLIDLGSDDGVTEGMGAESPSGIAGMVVACSAHYSLVASVLNTDMHFSCRIKGSDVTGSLSWDGRDIREGVLSDLPGHVMWSAGDTVLTSGFSEAFAEGVPVGVIAATEKPSGAAYATARVTLFTRFDKLPQLRLTKMRRQEEINQLKTRAAL